MSIETMIYQIIEREGGYVNHPADRGGPTNFGITAKTLGAWRGSAVPASAGEIRGLTEKEAFQIYYDIYVRKPNFIYINAPHLREAVVDFGVNSGVRRASEALQKAVGAPADGIVGPVTLRAVNAGDPQVLSLKVNLYRALFVLSLVGRSHNQVVFARGWANRINEVAGGIL
ncbi:MAG: hypothetical protein EA405_13370 [Rhodospirillales bacterium]|nr:MAG: hypothetical protein EA405_13370 [Rhodospirillales bacterium]